jgi:hypothetical protein
MNALTAASQTLLILAALGCSDSYKIDYICKRPKFPSGVRLMLRLSIAA